MQEQENDRSVLAKVTRHNNIKPITKKAPTIATLKRWESEGGCEATDGCWTEPDGTCEHGKKSWLLVLGMI